MGFEQYLLCIWKGNCEGCCFRGLGRRRECFFGLVVRCGCGRWGFLEMEARECICGFEY